MVHIGKYFISIANVEILDYRLHNIYQYKPFWHMLKKLVNCEFEFYLIVNRGLAYCHNNMLLLAWLEGGREGIHGRGKR